jgi:Fic family protein
LATLILYERDYDFRRLFALEDYYNTDRLAYYRAINIGKTYERRRADITSWLEYFVKGFKKEIDEIKEKILQLSTRAIDGKIKSQIYLAPKQLKIIDFMNQVGRISAKDVEDVLSCPRRTAQLHLQRLKKIKIIKAIGKGKSTMYILNS